MQCHVPPSLTFLLPLFDLSLPPSAPESLVSPLRTGSRSDFLSQLNFLDTSGYEPHLVMLDAGLVSILSDDNLDNFLDLFQAVASFDGSRAADLLISRSKTPNTVINEPLFRSKFESCLLGLKTKALVLSKIKISDILSDALDYVREHHVRLEGEFINVVISILLLEGNQSFGFLSLCIPVFFLSLPLFLSLVTFIQCDSNETFVFFFLISTSTPVFYFLLFYKRNGKAIRSRFGLARKCSSGSLGR